MKKYPEFTDALNKYKKDFKIKDKIRFTKPYISSSVNQRVISIIGNHPKSEAGNILLLEDGNYHFQPYAKAFRF